MQTVSLDTILKEDHIKTIYAMFALICLTIFKRILFFSHFLIGSYVKTMLVTAILMGVGVTGHNSEMGPPKDHFPFDLGKQF